MGQIIYKVRQECKKHPEWSYKSVIYELNTRQFTAQGTFAAATEHLPRLAALGIDILWIMPIFPIGRERRKGTCGSYYSIADYTAVNEEFGSLDDFRQFVNRAHSLGMRVILDWVANHTARDARWAREHPDWYVWNEAKGEIETPFDWSDTAKLDFSNAAMRDEMIRSMRFWLRETKIDGYRCDMAMLVPIDFWDRATAELTLEMEGQGRELFMLAESEGPEFHNAFDATYGWELHHIFNSIAQGEANCYTLGERLSHENSIYPYSAMRMQFTSNHDENSWNGSAITRMGVAAPAFAALSFMLSGMPLIYNGQECSLERSLEFFERDPIDWKKLESEGGRRATTLYSDLCRLKHTHPALAAGEQGGNIAAISNSEPWRVFAIKREVEGRIVIGVFNLSNTSANIEFYDDDFRGAYKQLGADNEAILSSNSPFHIPAWGYFVYYK